MIYDLTIIGGGPAGVAAGVYAARKQLKTLFITDSFGGQSSVSSGIENWIGDIKISGHDLAKKMENHLLAYADPYVSVKKLEQVSKVKLNSLEKNFTIFTNKSEYNSKSILITSGAHHKKLNVKNLENFENKGVMYCATCDGPMFSGKTVAVVGGGNSALEGVMQLLSYSEKVYLIHRRSEFKADPVTVEAVRKNPKLEIILDSEVTEILGDNFLNSIIVKNKNTEIKREIFVSGLFVEIGSDPNSGFVSDLLDLTEEGNIKIDPWNQRTSLEGIWAAGDVTNVKYHQNNIAAGDAVRALEDIYVWLKSNS